MTWNPRRARRDRRLDGLEQLRVARRVVADDVTVLGEQLAELHVDTLADRLDDVATHHYRRGLDGYEHAKERLRTAATAEDLVATTQLVEDARYHRACVLAVRDDEELPTRREPCFFDPRHGPSTTDVVWSPPSGTARPVPVCAADARRLAGDEPPQVRLVRIGDRYVPWHEVGSLEEVMRRTRDVLADAARLRHQQHQLAPGLELDAFDGFDGYGGGPI